MNLELIYLILSGNDSYIEKRFTRCTDTYSEKIENRKLAKSLCDESSYCNAIAVPNLHSTDKSYKLCKGKHEFSETENILAKGNLAIHLYLKRKV